MPSPYNQSLYSLLGGPEYRRNVDSGKYDAPDNLGDILTYRAASPPPNMNSPQYQQDLGMRMAPPSQRGQMRQTPPVSPQQPPRFRHWTDRPQAANTNLRDLLFRYGVDDQGPGVQNMPFIYGVDDQNPNPIVPLYNRMNPSQPQNSYYDYGPSNGMPWYMR